MELAFALEIMLHFSLKKIVCKRFYFQILQLQFFYTILYVILHIYNIIQRLKKKDRKQFTLAECQSESLSH